MEKTHQHIQTDRQLKGLMISLIVEFILGVSLTTFINYDPTKQDILQTIVLILHIIIGIGIVTGGVIRFISSIRWHYLQTGSLVGLISTVGAFLSGGIAARTTNAVAVFIMAILFITAFTTYGASMLNLHRSSKQPTENTTI